MLPRKIYKTCTRKGMDDGGGGKTVPYWGRVEEGEGTKAQEDDRLAQTQLLIGGKRFIERGSQSREAKCTLGKRPKEGCGSTRIQNIYSGSRLTSSVRNGREKSDENRIDEGVARYLPSQRKSHVKKEENSRKQGSMPFGFFLVRSILTGSSMRILGRARSAFLGETGEKKER